MKTPIRIQRIAAIVLALFTSVEIAGAANVTAYGSIVSLATNVTQNYTFIDPSSGQNVIIAVTMTPYSTSNASPAFALLDADANNNYTHLGIDSGLGSGDGNWVDSFEGVNFTVSLVSASDGVIPGSIQFCILKAGLRPGSGVVKWSSSAGTHSNLLSDELQYVLDTNTVWLSGTTYSAQLLASGNTQFQLSDSGGFAGSSIVFVTTFGAVGAIADPRTNSWFTTYAGKYARVYTNDAMKSAGNTLTNWVISTMVQTNPAYCGVQEIYSSTNWVYVRSTGLAGYIMGPWYLNTNHTLMFPNLPVNQKLLFRFPRTNGVPATKTLTGGGQIGIFVDGVEMFNSWDAFTWNSASNADVGNFTGYWNRDAYVNEGATFDAGYAHQQGSGTYHYHANPIALRYQLGDHVDFNPVNKTYSESTNTTTRHSPILAWTADGYPVYGPYGYSVATNANTAIRRMIPGYVLRNGQSGTTNLATVGRKTIPQWAVRIFNVASNQTGPNVTPGFPLGRYMEDNDYLGDHGYVQGVDFDLDEYNGRFCVTPEFPGGTYAYFVAVTANGTPAFPYNIGRAFRGDPVGATATAITEKVLTNFLGNTNLSAALNPPTARNGSVTLTWTALEGGSYQVEATTNLAAWTVVQSGIKPAPGQIGAIYTNVTSLDDRFYRIGRTSVATYDSAGVTLFATNGVTPGGSASRGQTVLLTITLPASPPNPPAGAPVSSVTIGSITATSTSYTTSGTVQAMFTIPAGYSPTGSQNVVVTFNPNPSYTLTGGFTIN